jgi:23S rRNA (pseudouridine1915-N3)-methyltransferase
MQIKVIAIGQNMPSWVDEACKIYQSRLPSNHALEFKSLPIIKRTKSSNIPNIIKQESDSLLKAVSNNSYIIALDATGKSLSTEQMTKRIEDIKLGYSNISFIIGGPDGLSTDLKQKANEIWSLSKLTYAHPVVRVVMAEQIYRCWSLSQNHPYHR